MYSTYCSHRWINILILVSLTLTMLPLEVLRVAAAEAQQPLMLPMVIKTQTTMHSRLEVEQVVAQDALAWWSVLDTMQRNWTESASTLPSTSVEKPQSAPSLMFIENVGQFDEQVRFQVRGGGHTVWLTEDGIWITLSEPVSETLDSDSHNNATLQRNPQEEHHTEQAQMRRQMSLHLSFPEANVQPRIVAYGPLPTRMSYFLGNDPAGWHADVPVWQEVRYEDLYPGVDLVITGENGQWDWQMVCYENCSTALQQVRLHIEGADVLTTDDAHIYITTPIENLRLPLLQGMELTNVSEDTRRPPGKARGTWPNWRITDVTVPGVPYVSNNDIVFPFASDARVLSTESGSGSNYEALYFSVLFGGSDSDGVSRMAVDDDGAVYVTGSTSSSDFITTTTLFTQTTHLSDAFATRIVTDSGAVTLTHSVILGGGGNDYGEGIALDGENDVYLVGHTQSSTFPTTEGAYAREIHGEDNGAAGDAFVAKLAMTDTTNLQYSTFLGGELYECAQWKCSIAVSDTMTGTIVYVVGDTESYISTTLGYEGFPTTAYAYDSHNDGGYDLFIAKMDLAGEGTNDLLYGSYLGVDASDEHAGDMVIDSYGKMYITGETYPDGETSVLTMTIGAYDVDYNGGGDSFFIVFDPSEDEDTTDDLVYSTFLGGTGADTGYALDLDDDGNVYITGATRSGDFPTTPGAYKTSYNGGEDGFIVRLRPEGNGSRDLLYASFFGGSADTEGMDVIASEDGSIWITGATKSSDLPVTPGAFDGSYGGGTYDAFLLGLSPCGIVIYTTYLGGAGSDRGEALALDDSGNIYVAGETSSADFITTTATFGPPKDQDTNPISTSLRYAFVTAFSLSTILDGAQTWAQCECPFVCSTSYASSRGGPINTRTGNYHYSIQDISLPALGGPIYFERSYNVQATGLYTQPLGPGWTHNYNLDLTFPDEPGGASGAVTVKGCGGSRFRFADNGDGTFDPAPAVWATLTRTLTPPYTYTLTGVNQSIYVFNHDGQLVSIRDPQGHALTLTYTGGQLSRVADATDERFLTLTYSGTQLVQVQDPLGRTIGYTYDIAGDLTTVTDMRDFIWTYTYTDSHLLTEVRNPLDQIIERTEFDAYRRAVRQWTEASTEPLEIDYGASIVITDSLKHTRTDTYSANGLLTGQSDAPGVLTRTYDTNFNWTSTTDANANTTDYTFNAMGLPEVITNAQEATAQMTYDTANHLTTIEDARGNTTSYEYEGNLLITTTDELEGTVINTYDDNLLIRTVARGLTTTYEYNPWGQRTAIIDATGLVTRYEYDLVGRLITTTAPTGLMTVNAYDAGNNLIRVTRNYTYASAAPHYLGMYNLITEYGYDQVGRRTYITDTQRLVTRSEYDAAGRLVRSTRNYLAGYPQNYQYIYNLVTEYGYDDLGRQTHVTDTQGSVTYTEYDALGRIMQTTRNYLPGYTQNYQDTYNLVTGYGYDAVGNQILVTDTLGGVTYTEYDELNRVQRTWQNYLVGYAQNYQDTYNLVTTYEYDEVGNQIRVTDTLDHVTYTEYDKLNRPVTVTTNYVDGVYASALPDEDLIRVTVYDENGRVFETRDPAGHVTRNEYDPAGRLITVITNYENGNYAPGYPDEDIKQVTVYDDATGRVTARWQIADTTIPTYYEYDVLGRLVTTTNALSGTTVTQYDALGRRAASIDAEGNATHYGYDIAGRLVTTTNAMSGTVVTTYDALGRRVAQTNPLGHTIVYTYDVAGRLIAQADPLGNVTTYEYDALGRRTVITDADGVATATVYDAVGRVSATSDVLGNTTTYAYDALGRRTVVIDSNDITTRYEYDDLGRLTAVTENYQTPGQEDDQTNVRTEYAYDTLGNLRVITDALNHTTVYTYDDLGRRIAEADALGNVTAYVYDGHGRRTNVVYPDASGPITVSTAYNALGWATDVSYPGVGDVPGFTVSYGYNQLGQREAVTDSTGTMTYDYDALYRPLDVDAPTGDVTYTYDAAGQRTHLIYPTGQTVTYTHDVAGRLRTVTDWEEQTTIYTYTAAGRLSGMVRPNGVASAYSYDAAGRLIQIEHTDFADQLLMRYTYTLDGVGNRTHITETQSIRQEITSTGYVSVQSNAPATYVGNSLSIMLDGPVTEYRFPDVTSLDGDEYIDGEQYLSVWLGYPGIGTGPAVYGRAVSSAFSNADTLGASILIRSNTSGNVTWQSPRVSYDPTSGRALVVWKEGYDIYGRLVNMRTTPPTLVGTQPFIVADGDGLLLVNYAAVAANTEEGGFFVVYERSGASDDVYGQFVSSSGGLDREAFEIVTNALDPDVVFYPDSPKFEFMVVWETQEYKERFSSIQGRLVGTEELASIFTVYTSEAGQYDPAVSYNLANQRFLVAWNENGGINGQQLTTLGGYYGSLIAISASGSVPDVGGNALNGNWLVSWSGNQVFAREISSSGGLVGDLLIFGAGETSQIIAVSQASPYSGRYLTVWNQTDDILGRLVGPNLVAGFAASPTNGPTQSTVHFTDTTQLPGMADQWQWNFGDGAQSSAQHPEHIYTQSGVYTVQLTAIDQDTGDTDSVYLTQGITVVNPFILETRAITYTYDPLNRLIEADYSTGENYTYQYDAVGNRTQMGTAVIGEVNQITTLTDVAQTVYFKQTYNHPVVFAQPPSTNEGDTAVVRILDVQADRFTLRVHEAPNKNGTHRAETVSYVVLEAGSWQLADGTQLEVGTVDTAATRDATPASWESISFAQAFADVPVILSQVQTNNDPHWVKTRQTNVAMTDAATTGFSVALEEDQAQTTPHGTETIGWLAIDAGEGSWDGHTYVADLTENSINSSWRTIEFKVEFTSAPRFVGALATYNNGDPAAVRYQSLTAGGVQVRVEEDTTQDGETGHPPEVVAYLAIEGDGLLTVGATTYTYDAANRLISVNGVPYTWDARGNLIHDGVYTYTYNAAGRMVRAASTATTVVYTYTADGLRVAQNGDGREQTFAWDWATGVPEMLYDGQYTYLVGHDTLGWEGARTPMSPVEWTYVLPDALGSVRQETDATGTVTAVREWSPYGVELGGAQAGLGYTGEWYDPSVGMIYLRARWLDSVNGIFTSRDPVEAEPPYQYVRCNPLRWTDPSGYIIEPWNAGDEYFYSCKCGWIDTSHARSTRDLIQAVRDIGASNPMLSSEWQLYHTQGGQDVMGQAFNLYGDFLVRREGVINRRSANEVSLAIHIAWNNFWEVTGQGSHYLAGPISTFSEEDLVSNLIGYHRGLWELKNQRPKVEEGDPESLKYFMKLCRVVGYEYYERGQMEFFRRLQRSIALEYLGENGLFRKHDQWGNRPDGRWSGELILDPTGLEVIPPLPLDPLSVCSRSFSCNPQQEQLPWELISVTPQPPGQNWVWKSGRLEVGGEVTNFDPTDLNDHPLNWLPH